MSTTWSTQEERDAEFFATTFATYEFRVRDEFDNGEFITGATVDLIVRGKVVHTETFVASSEDAPGPMSAYWNGRDNHATTQALSYAHAWLEGAEREAEAERLSKKLGREVHPLEIAWAPFGSEWQREQEEVCA